MTASTVYELIGYLGSALVIVSLTRTSLVKLRLFGLAGSLMFLVYSLAIAAYPIAVVNLIIAGIHIVFLQRLLKKTNALLRILPIRADSRYLRYFLEFHAADIALYYPNFAYEPRESQIAVFILRDTVPAGLFIAHRHPDRSLEIKIDYVTPQYRDFQVGRYLYSKRSGVFADPQIAYAWREPPSDLHKAYMTMVGFVPAERDGHTIYRRDLSPFYRADR